MRWASALPALESLDVLLTWRNERPLVSDQQRHLLTASRHLLEDLKPHPHPCRRASLETARHSRASDPASRQPPPPVVVNRDEGGASPLGWPS